MIKHAVPHYIAGRLDDNTQVVEYATIAIDFEPLESRAAVLFTSLERARQFIEASDRRDFVPVRLDYDHLRRWLEGSVSHVAPLVVVDVPRGETPSPAIAFELSALLEALESVDADEESVTADSFAVIV